jgi:2-hydroxychromene-2-carboxylate isomerase
VTQTAPSQSETTQKQAVDFYFDVSCPWAWRTSLWIREVEKVRPIQVTWKFLSLAKINEANDYARDSHTASHATFPLLAWARERFGNEAVDRLYLALGRARHERKESLADPAVIERALSEAGLSRLAHRVPPSQGWKSVSSPNTRMGSSGWEALACR